MIAPEYFNNHVAVEGEIIVKSVPNDAGFVLVWNPTTKKISRRTHTELISDLNLVTSNQLGNYWEKHDGGSWRGINDDDGRNFSFLTNGGGSAKRVNTGGLLTSDLYSDEQYIPANGIYSKGNIATANYGSAIDWAIAYNWTQTQGATMNWVNANFVTINTAQDINARKSIGGGTGNEYTGAALEIRGNGSTIFPSISFHQPGAFAGAMSYRGDDYGYYFMSANADAFRWLNALGYRKSGSNDDYFLTGGGGHKLIGDFFRNDKIESKPLSVVATTLDEELPNGGFISSYYSTSWGGTDRPVGASYGGYIKFSDGGGNANNLDFYYNNGHNADISRIWFRTKEAINGTKPWIELWHTENLNPVRIGGSGVSYNPIYLGWTGTQLQIQVDNSVIGNIWHTSNLNPVTLDTEQYIGAAKWFITSGGNQYLNHGLRVLSQDGSNPGIVFYKEGANVGTIQYEGSNYLFTTSNTNAFANVVSAGFIKEGSNDDYALLGGGGHMPVSSFASGNYTNYQDNREINPSEMEPKKIGYGFTTWDNNNNSPYADYLHFGGYQDDSGGRQNLIVFRKDGFGLRQWQGEHQSINNYSDYVDYWHTGSLPNPVDQSQLSGYVRTTGDQNIDGIKGFTGAYTQWILNGDPANARGFVQPTPNEFLLGTLNNKNVLIYRNSIEKIVVEDLLTTFRTNISVPNAIQNDHAVNLGQLNSQMGNYLPLSGGTLTSGGRIDSQGNIIIQQTDSGGNATGIWWEKIDDSDKIGGIGAFTANGEFGFAYMGWGAYPWDVTTNLSVGENVFAYKNNQVWHAGILPNPATQDQLNTKVNKSGDTMTGTLNALTISAQNGADKLIYDNIENFGSTLKINANASLGIQLQSNNNTKVLIDEGGIALYGNVTTTGALNINTSNNHLQFSENGVGKWHMESLGGEFNLVETGVAQRFRISPNASTPTYNGYGLWHAGNFNPDLYLTQRGGYHTALIAKTDFPLSITDYTGDPSTTGFQSYFGTSFHFKGPNSWYNRLDFPTNAEKLFLYQGINTTDMTLRGYIPVLNGNVTNWDSTNFNPNTKVSKSGDTMTGGLIIDTLDAVGSNNLGVLPTNYKLFLANNDSRYGTVHWVEGNGQGYIQQQRADGNPIAYRLNLQPYGGELFYGDSEVATQDFVNANDKTFITDSRGAVRPPSFYDDRFAQWDFQYTDDTQVTGDAWQGVLTVSKWETFDPSHRQEQILFTGDNLKRRTAIDDNTWGPEKTIWDSGNFTPANFATTSQLNDKVNKSGDTMTGALLIGNTNIGKQRVLHLAEPTLLDSYGFNFYTDTSTGLLTLHGLNNGFSNAAPILSANRANNFVGINKENATTELDVNGNITSNGFIKNNSSDDYFLMGGGGQLTKYSKDDSYVNSHRDFPDGTLITTNIDYSHSAGDSFLLEIKGNMYGGGLPMDTKVQGYIYADTIINQSGYSTYADLTTIIAMNINGNLCFWFPRLWYWQGFSVKVIATGGGGITTVNRVTSIDNSAEPVGTKQVKIAVYTLSTQSWVNNQGFLTSANLNGYVTQSALNTQLGSYATLNGVQTFNNTNTFNQSPVIPNGTLGNHAVNLNQLLDVAPPYHWNYVGQPAITNRRVLREMTWNNYGNGHTIFDISSGTTPWGTSKSNVDAEQQWSPSYPTLVGGNGSGTYGVRVDSSRVSDTTNSLGGYGSGDFLNTTYLNNKTLDSSDATVKGVMTNYSPSSDPDKPVGVTDGSLLTLNYSSIWSTQLYGDWRNKDLYFRTQNGGVWNTYSKFWHTDNFNPSQYVTQTGLNFQLGNYATLAGVQTFNNTNTFNQSPIIPHGTLGNHAVNLNQLNGKVNNLENVTGVGFSSGNADAAPYFYHPVNGYRFLATQTWVNTNFIPTSHPVHNITQANINSWNAGTGGGSSHTHFNLSYLNNIDQYLGTGQAPQFSSVRLMNSMGYGTLALEEDYIGGEAGLVDLSNEVFYAGRINEYLKYGSSVNGFEGLNIHFDAKLLGIGREIGNDEDKVQLAGDLSVDTVDFDHNSRQLVLNPLYNADGDVRRSRNAHIYIVTRNPVRLPDKPILGQRIEIFNDSDSDIEVTHGNVGTMFKVPAFCKITGIAANKGFRFDAEPIRTKQYDI